MWECIYFTLKKERTILDRSSVTPIRRGKAFPKTTSGDERAISGVRFSNRLICPFLTCGGTSKPSETASL